MDIHQFKRVHYITAVLLFLLFFFLSVSAAPNDFPRGQIISIRQGAGLLEASRSLKRDHVIRSSAWFRVAILALGGEKNIRSGDYYLPYRQSVYAVAWRVVHGDHRIDRVKLTIPEGFTNKKIAALFDGRFPLFNKTEFLSLADEGYMFPDTYFFGVNSTATSTIALLRQNFDKKIFPLTGDIASSGHTEREIVIMASILEGEANTPEDREIVSGILWKRLTKGMPLQVDASLTYVNGKASKDMTQGDLAFDSPYNTYVYKGLPPTAIGNPGLESIKAALHPTTTPYLYFLTGDDGTMHYARTYAEHQKNIEKYIGE